MLDTVCFYYTIFVFLVCFFCLLNCLFFCIFTGVVADFYWSRDVVLRPFFSLFLVHMFAYVYLA